MTRGSLKGRFGVLGGYTIAYLIFIYLPVVLLPIFSFNDSIYVAFPFKGLTLRWWQQMVSQHSMLNALVNSIQVAVPVAMLSTTLGILAAKSLTRYHMFGKPVVTGFFMLPLVIPFLILAIALLVVLNFAGVPLSLWTVGLAHIVICLPFAVFVLISRLEGFDRHIEEASLDLGETPWMTFWRVTLPIAFPGLMASLLLTFTISFDEFLLAFFLVGSEPTLPLYIWSQLRFPAKLPAVLALGSAILAVSCLLVATAERLRRQGAMPAGAESAADG